MKSERVAYVLLLVLGLLGAHRFYVGRNRTGGAILLLTLAGLTVFQPAVLAAVAWLIVDGRRQRAALDDLEARGVGRRAKSVNARPTAEKVPEA